MKGLRVNIYLFILISMFGIVSCNSAKSGGDSEDNPIDFKTFTSSDTLSIKLHYWGNTKVCLKYSVDFPEAFMNDEKTEALNTLFYKEILTCDSVKLSPEEVLKNIIGNYSCRLNLADSIIQDTMSDTLNINESQGAPSSIISEVTVKTVFNKDTILSVCKSTKTQNNTDDPMFERLYYNIDLNNMKIVELGDLFDEESLSVLNQMLKSKLLKQSNVANEEELIQLGYFNLDNLFAGNNFYINDKGITWNFLPLEISCFNIGETEIFLSYTDLSPLIIDNPSIISKYIVN